ncbi:MAG TPA: ZinT/AdcA family metal-binding protein [Thermotogota bacterium]|nr:ZinT/AdcA family metal-binding protein [Thermotogota bacterium]HPJ88837.1 ZinT/AdcA family metal-binding protein [Thermotogota bacterium]HPR97558.1 ZinT/AdcA family metal-binding protein [Thermotogota bacterium]
MKKFLLIMVTVVMLMGMMFAATEAAEKVTDLSGWKGVNISTTKILSGTRMNAYASEIAQYKEGYDAQMVKLFVDKMYYTTFFTWEVLDDARTVVFDNMYTGEYDYVGSFTTMWGDYELTWNIFKTETTEAINAGYKYLVLFPYHGHGEGAKHMHMRYGNASIDYLVTDPSLSSWWPTCYKAENMEEETLYSELMSGAKMMTTMLPDVK